MTASLEKIIGRLLAGKRVMAPGPGHSEDDLSLSVWPAKNADGFTVHSFAGDDPQACVEHVKSLLDPEKRAALSALGAALPARDDKDARELADPLAPGWYSRSLAPKVEGGPRALDGRRAEYVQYVRGIWNAARSPFGTQAEIYFWRSRHLDLTPDVAGDVIRFHHECPWKDDLTKKRFRTLAIVVAMRDIWTNEIVGVQRTRLSLIGEKLGRRMLGFAGGAAVKLDDDDAVTHGLVIGEGVETCLTARWFNLRPVWALGSKDQIAKFPVLSGVESLTILAEPDAEAGVRECAQRWHAAGREVLINRSKTGSDLNDALRGVA